MAILPASINPPTTPNNCTGTPGATGIRGTEASEDDLLSVPEKHEEATRTVYKVKDFIIHCPFGPAVLHKDGSEEWWVNHQILRDPSQIETAKAILADLRLAPLYIHDPLFKYYAKWMLKFPGSA